MTVLDILLSEDLCKVNLSDARYGQTWEFFPWDVPECFAHREVHGLLSEVRGEVANLTIV